MIISWCFICAFALLINKVSLDVTLVGFTGSSVVLPCSSTEHDLKLQDINVFWRHNGSETIYDLISGKDSVAGQNPRYKNRAQTFPDEYLRGNFSIKLINLNHADAGEFICFITHSSDSKQETIQLFINESTVEKGNNSTEPAETKPAETKPAETKPAETKSYQRNIIIICVSIIVFVIFLPITYFIIRWRKGTSAPL